MKQKSKALPNVGQGPGKLSSLGRSLAKGRRAWEWGDGEERQRNLYKVIL